MLLDRVDDRKFKVVEAVPADRDSGSQRRSLDRPPTYLKDSSPGKKLPAGMSGDGRPGRSGHRTQAMAGYLHNIPIGTGKQFNTRA